MQTAIRWHLPQLIFFLILLVLLSPAKPINADSGDLCLNVAHTVGISTYSLKTQKLTTPDFTGLDLLLANAQYAKWSGTRAAYIWQQTQDQWALSITDIQTRQTITTAIIGQGLIRTKENGMEPRFFGWSADGLYLAVEVLRNKTHTLLFYRGQDATVVEEMIRNPFVMERAPDSDADRDIPAEAHWSPVGHNFAMFVLMNTGELGLIVFSPDWAGLAFRWPAPDYKTGEASFWFDWSPDARFLAANDASMLRVFGIDGKTVLEDTFVGDYSDNTARDLVWSADGKALYYVRKSLASMQRCRGTELIAFSSDNRQRRKITSDFFVPPIFSPDKHSVLLSNSDSTLPCVNSDADDFPMTYRLVNVEEGEQLGTSLQRTNRVSPLPVRWSPDSRNVALLFPDHLVWMRADGTAIHILPGKNVVDAGSDGADPQFQWSADGQWMAYGIRAGNDKENAWLTNIETGSSVALGTFADAYPQVLPSLHGSPAAILTPVSSDSSSSSADTSLWLVSEHVSRKVSDHVRIELNGIGGTSAPVWSPDGTLLAYVSSEDSDSWTTHIVGPDGAEITQFKTPSHFSITVSGSNGAEKRSATLGATLSWGECKK